MKKIEIIWRELLFQAIENKLRQFQQKKLAEQLGVSTSTIFQALKAPRAMGAVRVTGRFFILEDPEKLLYHWASVRNLKKEILFAGSVRLPVLEIEGLMPPDIIFACYSAARYILKEVPADYDTVYVYSETADSLRERFSFTKGRANMVILKQDPLLGSYGQRTTLAQTFVDLWNLSDWQAKEFTKALKEEIDGLLS